MQIGWTFETYVIYNEDLRKAEEKFQTERDRRYTEVNVEKEKALKIKETADLTALELARESQVYKDERNDSMREQSIKESGIYATRDDLTVAINEIKQIITPLADYVSTNQGQEKGSRTTKNQQYVVIGLICSVVGMVFLIINNLFR